MNSFRITCYAICSAVVLWCLAPAASAQTVAPGTAQSTRLGVYLGGGCDGGKRLEGFSQWLGRKPDFVVDFLAWESWEATTRAAGWVGRCWKDKGMPVVVSVPMLPKAKSASLEAGVRGDYDEGIANVARQLVNTGHGDAIIRLGWEFNADWFTWSASKRPEVFVAYWRRIVGVMRAVPGAQFRFDWNPIIGPGMRSPAPAYPGDDVVDIIGADVYNNNYFPPSFTAAQRWKAMRDGPVGLRWHREFARRHNKPMSFPEWGTGTRPDGHGGGDDPVFMRGMVEWIAENTPEYQSYWDYPARDFNARLSNGKQPQAERIFLDAYGIKR